jgi:hypothetical protein
VTPGLLESGKEVVMRHVTRWVVVLVASLALALVARAQALPDFSGTWTMDPARSTSAGENEPVRSQILTIRTTGRALSIERTWPEKGDTAALVTYKPGTANSSFGIENIWYWEGQRLVAEATHTVSGQTVRTREVYSIDASGDLSVQRLLVVEHGYTLKGGKNYGSGTDVYKKTAP